MTFVLRQKFTFEYLGLPCINAEIKQQATFYPDIMMKSTLRVGPKNGKTSPRTVKWVGEQDEQIKYFLDLRAEVKSIFKKNELI